MTNEETTTRLGSFSYLDDISSTIDFSEILKKHRKENEGPLHPSEKELQVEYQGYLSTFIEKSQRIKIN